MDGKPNPPSPSSDEGSGAAAGAAEGSGVAAGAGVACFVTSYVLPASGPPPRTPAPDLLASENDAGWNAVADAFVVVASSAPSCSWDEDTTFAACPSAFARAAAKMAAFFASRDAARSAFASELMPNARDGSAHATDDPKTIIIITLSRLVDNALSSVSS